jgi:hypothetical protein
METYLTAIHQQEEEMCSSKSVYFPQFEKLKLLQAFCSMGTVPPNQIDALVKELMKYRLLDIFAFVHGMALETKTKAKGIVPFTDKLVRLFMPAKVLFG